MLRFLWIFKNPNWQHLSKCQINAKLILANMAEALSAALSRVFILRNK